MQLPQNVKPQPRVLPEEADELSCRLLDAGSIVSPARAPRYTPVNFVCYCIPWEGQDFTAGLGGNLIFFFHDCGFHKEYRV